MVKKIISCADIHFPRFNKIDELEEQLEKFYSDCEKIVKEEGGPQYVRIAVAGDIFHNKIDVTNESILAVHKFLKRLGSIAKTIVIIGNHDFIMNNTDRLDSLSTIFEIGGLDNVVYLDDVLGKKSGCYEDDNIVWCLYSSFSAFSIPDIKSAEIEYPRATHTYVGIIHGEINGSTTALGHVSEKALSPEIFDGCDCVIAGHIHKRQEINENGIPIVYCSSIVQKDMGETVTGHGYVLWDIDNPTGKPQYEAIDIPNEDGGFYKFVISSPNDIAEDKEELINL